MPVIEVEGVKKSYSSSPWRFWEDRNHTQALKGVSFEVEDGEIFSVVGPNGAGKTTLINILNGLLYKDEGSVKIFGEETRENRQKIAKRMNVATSYSALSGNLTVRENLKVFGKIYNVKNIDERIDELLKIFQIEKLENKKVWHISAGQKTRANLCKSLINKPELLLLDEATAGLDPHIAEITRNAIKKVNEEYGTTILITSHNMSDIDKLSDRILFLHNGKVLKEGTPEELKREIHIKILEVSYDGKKKSLEDIKQKWGGDLSKSLAKFKIEKEEDIVEILDELSNKKIKITDIEAKNPDLEEVFKKVAGDQV